MPPHSDRHRPKLPKGRDLEDLSLENEMLRLELAERNEEIQLLRQEREDYLRQIRRLEGQERQPLAEAGEDAALTPTPNKLDGPAKQ